MRIRTCGFAVIFIELREHQIKFAQNSFMDNSKGYSMNIEREEGLKMGDITKHISNSETACHCGCGENNFDLDFLRNVDKFIHDHFEDARIKIDCVCRCRPHNKAVGGVENSLHISDTPHWLKSRAIDIGEIQGMSMDAARNIANANWVGGVEQGVPWLHLDSGPNRRFQKP
jgi:hypothetical protein